MVDTTTDVYRASAHEVTIAKGAAAAAFQEIFASIEAEKVKLEQLLENRFVKWTDKAPAAAMFPEIYAALSAMSLSTLKAAFTTSEEHDAIDDAARYILTGMSDIAPLYDWYVEHWDRGINEDGNYRQMACFFIRRFLQLQDDSEYSDNAENKISVTLIGGWLWCNSIPATQAGFAFIKQYR